jgi:hypothetical protein
MAHLSDFTPATIRTINKQASHQITKIWIKWLPADLGYFSVSDLNVSQFQERGTYKDAESGLCFLRLLAT